LTRRIRRPRRVIFALLCLLVVTLSLFPHMQNTEFTNEHITPIRDFRIAETASEWLDCTTHDNTASQWDENGDEPWLDADDSNTIDTKIDGETHSYFGFGTTSLSGTITVNVSVLCWNEDGAGNDHFALYYNIGAGNVLVSATVGDDTTPTYETFGLGDFTEAQVNAMEFSFISDMVTQPDEVYADHLRIGLSAEVSEGDEYEVTINEVLDIADSTDTQVELSVVINEHLEIFDSVTTALRQSIIINEVLDFFDSVTTVIKQSVVINEVLDFFDSVTTTIRQSIIINEVLDFFDSITTGIPEGNFYEVVIYEILDIYDSIETALRTSVTIREILQVFDSIVAVINPTVIISVVIYELIQIIGEIGEMEELDIFHEVFLSHNMWGFFGVVILVIVGFFITKKEKNLGIFMIIIYSLALSQYFTLLETNPIFWWQIIILILGVIQCIFQLADRR